MRNVKDPDEVKRGRGESEEAYRMKKLLVALGLKLGFIVDVEETPDSELGDLGIRHDVIWYTKPPKWYVRLLKIVSSRKDLEPRYKDLLETKLDLKRRLYVAFEVEGSDLMTKAMKGDISNLSKWPYGIIVVRRGRREAEEESKRRGRYVEPIRNRFERALMEFRKLHGPNNVVIVSFEDMQGLCREYEVKID
jgi:hypothetical protein